MGSYTSISADYGITFNDVTFLFKIDHDDGTVNTDYAMRKLDMNHVSFDLFCTYKHHELLSIFP